MCVQFYDSCKIALNNAPSGKRTYRFFQIDYCTFYGCHYWTRFVTLPQSTIVIRLKCIPKRAWWGSCYVHFVHGLRLPIVDKGHGLAKSWQPSCCNL